jgi:hypothetical protein
MTAPPTQDVRLNALSAARWLRWGVAFVWLWTGFAVLHPYYREQGTAYLAPLGLPTAVMYATCAAEVLLGLRVAFGRATTWLTVLQIVMIAGFTAILSVSQPTLWLDPMGVLTKNVPLLVMIATAWLLQRGLALFWALDGTFRLVGGSPWFWPAWEFFAALLICYKARNLPISVIGAGMLLPLRTVEHPLEWFHPFGPLTKVVAIAIASIVGAARLTPRRREGPPGSDFR